MITGTRRSVRNDVVLGVKLPSKLCYSLASRRGASRKRGTIRHVRAQLGNVRAPRKKRLEKKKEKSARKKVFFVFAFAFSLSPSLSLSHFPARRRLLTPYKNRLTLMPDFWGSIVVLLYILVVDPCRPDCFSRRENDPCPVYFPITKTTSSTPRCFSLKANSIPPHTPSVRQATRGRSTASISVTKAIRKCGLFRASLISINIVSAATGGSAASRRHLVL